VRNSLLLVGALAMLAWTNLKLTLVVVLLAPLVVLPVIVLGRRVRRLSRTGQDRVADVSVYVDEALHEIRTVQAYTYEAQAKQAFGERVEATFEAGIRRIALKAMLIGLVMLAVFGGVGFILWIGGSDVLAGRLSPGNLSAFVFYCAVAAGSVAAISEVLGELQRAAGATEPLFPARHGGPLSRDAVARLLTTHTRAAATTCPTLHTKTVSPHVLRHTTAVNLLQAGVDRAVIALILGHESIDTTQMYLDADLTAKERALALTAPTGVRAARFRPRDALLAFLEAL